LNAIQALSQLSYGPTGDAGSWEARVLNGWQSNRIGSM
jgi:hypothetical protein